MPGVICGGQIVDKQLEEVAKSWDRCQSVKNSPAVAPLHHWVLAVAPKAEDPCAGPFKQKMYFVIVDTHSKWPKVIEMVQRHLRKQLKYYDNYLQDMVCQNS